MSTNLDKHTKYKGIRRVLVSNFKRNIVKKIASLNPETILDAGCGEGFIMQSINKYNIVGCDISEEAIKYAKKMNPGKEFLISDICNMPYKDNQFDLVLCLEVLEHMKKPERALEEIERVCKKYIIFSVPWEPVFTLCNLVTLKHIKTFGNHPEHVQHWTKTSFRKYVSKYFKVVECKIVFPWVIIIAHI